MTLQNAYAEDDDWDISPRREAEIMQTAPTTHQSFAEALEEARGVSQMTDAADEMPTFNSGRGVLSREEIAFLLRGGPEDAQAEEEAPKDIRSKEMPDLYAEIDADDIDGSVVEQMREDVAAAMVEVDHQMEMDRFSQRFGSRLSLALREATGLRAIASVFDVSEITFSAAIRAISKSESWAYACFVDDEGEVVATLNLSAPLVNRIVEAACGGRDGTANIARSISPMDVALIEALMRPMGRALLPALSFSRVEIDQDFAAVLAGPVEGAQLDLNIRIGAHDMSAQLMLANAQIERFASPKKSAAPPAPQPDPPAPLATETPMAASIPPLIETPAKIPPAVTTVMQARVASLRVPMSRIADLKPGATLLLGVPADQPVELITTGAGKPELVAEGTIGRKGNKMAIKISRRGPVLRRG